MNGLTVKQRKFIDYYLESGNATEAAKRAGYSEKTAHATGWENLRKPEISGEIEQRLKANAMSVDEALSILADMARSDLGDVFEFVDGVKQPYIRLTPENAHLVRKFKRDADGKIEVELEDRQAAIDKILKVAGAFKEQIEHVGELVINVNVKGKDASDED